MRDPEEILTHGRRRVVIESISPTVDHGRFAAKRVVGDDVQVEADIFTDGHDAISAVVLYRKQGETQWNEAPMEALVNDRWRGSFRVDTIGYWEFTVEAWVDRFKTWRRDMQKRVAAQQDVTVDLLSGAELVGGAAERASGEDAKVLTKLAERLADASAPMAERSHLALDPDLAEVVHRWPDRSLAKRYDAQFPLYVDRERANFSAWYEMFPRSTSEEPGKHGTFADCEKRLDYIAAMGFDVVYLPPIHPIGRVHRKGKNNTREAGPDDVGSPWAIGAEEGGHKAIHPDLGTLEDFKSLISSARERGLELAMDIAFQAAPDHPYVKEHESWFRHRPDGTIQYAENPPKKYEDIYPFDFESEDHDAMWEELYDVMRYWCEQGVRVFRVDNPHTKPFAFWEWAIRRIKDEYPETLFLSEAFTRPKVMYRLAKLGFTQSYTYFAWRNTKWEFEQYLRELTQTNVVNFFRPNFWPNTPDILPENLQIGTRPAFMQRLALAATLSSNYGIYGPAFELMESRPVKPGSEEYLDSEKYQIRHWDLEREDSLKDFIARINRIRRENPALQRNDTLRFHHVDNEHLLAYSKHTPDGTNLVLTVVNLDVNYTQSGWVHLDLDMLGLPHHEPYQVHDVLGEGRYMWQGEHNYVEINPHHAPAQIFRIGRRVRSEQDFEYFM